MCVTRPANLGILYLITLIVGEPIQASARSMAWVCGSSLAGKTGRIPPWAWTSVSCERCVLSGRNLCDGPITRPEESYRVWCVWVWSWSLDNEEAMAHWGAVAPWNIYSRTSIIRTSIIRNVKYPNPQFLCSTFKQRKISDYFTQ